MDVRRLKPAELLGFQARYEQATGYPPPLDYLRQATVYGVFDRGELVGGFAANRTAPWRYVNALPTGHRPQWEAEIAGVKVVEIGCAWLAQPLRKSWRSWLFWWWALQAARSGDVVLCGSTQRPLAVAYRRVLPTTREYGGGDGGAVHFDGLDTRGWVFLADRPTVAAVARAGIEKLRHRRRR